MHLSIPTTQHLEPHNDEEYSLLFHLKVMLLLPDDINDISAIVLCEFDLNRISYNHLKDSLLLAYEHINEESKKSQVLVLL